MQPRQRGFPLPARTGQRLKPLRWLSIQPGRAGKRLLDRMITRSPLQCFVTPHSWLRGVRLGLAVSQPALPAAQGEHTAAQSR